MKKIALYLEGLGEVIFVLQLLAVRHNYSGYAVETICPNFKSRVTLETLRKGTYRYGNFEQEPLNYLLVLVEGDSNVNSFMLQRAVGHFKEGFSTVIGLRDVYSQEFQDDVNSNVEPFTLYVNDWMISQRSKFEGLKNVFLNFAVMELEAWFIAMHAFILQSDFITFSSAQELLDKHLRISDILHPAEVWKSLYMQSMGVSYDKSEGTMHSICSAITQQAIDELLDSRACPDFNEFYEVLFQ